MIELAVLALLGVGAYYVWSSRAAAADTASIDPKKLPTVTTKPPAAGDGTCVGTPNSSIDNLDEGLRNAVLAALTVESDPAQLEEMAKSMDAACQGVAAKALRDKAALLTAKGVPVGWTGTSPLPGDTTPSPFPGFVVPTPAEVGFLSLTPEMDPAYEWAPTGAPSPLDVQWWSGPFSAAKGDSLYDLAKALTGDGTKYIDILTTNPEKLTVGDPGNPYSTGYSFAGLVDGERLRIPKSWNVYLADDGTKR